MLISVCCAARLMIPTEVGIASAATSSGMPAATSDPKTRIRTSAAIGSETVSARMRSSSDRRAECLLDRAEARQLDLVAGGPGAGDRRLHGVDQVDRAVLVDVEPDDDIGRVAGLADEPVVARLRVAGDAR